MAGYLGSKAVLLSTTAGTVTGDMTVGGDLEVSAANARIRLFETDTTDVNTQLQNQAGYFNIARLDDDAGGSTTQLRVNHATGNVLIPNGAVGIGMTPSADVSITDVAAGSIQTNGNIDIRYPGTNSDPAGTRYLSFINTDTTLVAGQPMGGIHWTGLDSSNPNSLLASITSYCAGNAGTNGDLRFEVSGSEAMRIDSSKSVFVGKTAAGGSTDGVQLSTTNNEFVANNGKALTLNRRSSTGELASFRYNNTAVGSISVSGSATTYNTSSDYRLKKDLLPMSGASERVMALKPVNFAWKIDDSRVDGFLAHELAEVVPEAATGAKDAMMDEEYEVTPATDTEEAVMGTRSVPDMQGIDQSKLVPLLTAALQEALIRIAALEAAQ